MVEDEPLYRELLASTLGQVPEIDVLGAFSGGSEAMQQLDHLQPDVALMDIDLGDSETGVAIGIKMKQVRPHMGIVLLSHYDEPGVLKSIPRSEVSGWCYLLKQSVSNIQVVVRTVQAAANGLMVLDPDLVRAFELDPRSWLSDLTPRQRQIIVLIAQGYSNLAISEALGITMKSVENYITQLYQALAIEANQEGLHPRVRATLTFLNHFSRPQ